MTSPLPPFPELTERFVHAILETVPLERLVTLHLFPPLRQGSAETGIAVVAAAPAGDELPPEARHVVYTARYRALLKGPERGKWDVEVVADADAPLLTVETVVRGVQQRAGDTDDPVRYEPAELAQRLRLPPADATPVPAGS